MQERVRNMIKAGITALVLSISMYSYADFLSGLKSIGDSVVDAAGSAVDITVSASTGALQKIKQETVLRTGKTDESAASEAAAAEIKENESDKAIKVAVGYLVGEFNEKASQLMLKNESRYSGSMSRFWSYVAPGRGRRQSQFGPSVRLYGRDYPELPALIDAGGGAVVPTTINGVNAWIESVRQGVAREEALFREREEQRALAKRAREEQVAAEKKTELERKMRERAELEMAAKRVENESSGRDRIVQNVKDGLGNVVQSATKQIVEPMVARTPENQSRETVRLGKSEEANPTMEVAQSVNAKRDYSTVIVYGVFIPVLILVVLLYGCAYSKVKAGQLVCYASWLDLFGSIAWTFLLVLGIFAFFEEGASTGSKIGGVIAFVCAAASFIWLFAGAFVYNRGASLWNKALSVGSRIIVGVLFLFAIAQLQQKLKELEDSKGTSVAAIKGAIVALALFAFIYKCLVKPMIGRRYCAVDLDE